MDTPLPNCESTLNLKKKHIVLLTQPVATPTPLYLRCPGVGHRAL